MGQCPSLVALINPSSNSTMPTYDIQNFASFPLLSVFETVQRSHKDCKLALSYRQRITSTRLQVCVVLSFYATTHTSRTPASWKRFSITAKNVQMVWKNSHSQNNIIELGAVLKILWVRVKEFIYFSNSIRLSNDCKFWKYFCSLLTKLKAFLRY